MAWVRKAEHGDEWLATVFGYGGKELYTAAFKSRAAAYRAFDSICEMKWMVTK